MKLCPLCTRVYVCVERVGGRHSVQSEMGTKNFNPNASKAPKISHLPLNEFKVHCTSILYIEHCTLNIPQVKADYSV